MNLSWQIASAGVTVPCGEQSLKPILKKIPKHDLHALHGLALRVSPVFFLIVSISTFVTSPPSIMTPKLHPTPINFSQSLIYITIPSSLHSGSFHFAGLCAENTPFSSISPSSVLRRWKGISLESLFRSPPNLPHMLSVVARSSSSLQFPVMALDTRGCHGMCHSRVSFWTLNPVSTWNMLCLLLFPPMLDTYMPLINVY